MLLKHIDYGDKEERLDFKRKKKGKHIVMVGGVPEEERVGEQRHQEAPSETDSVARQIIESLEKGEEE